MPKIIFTGGGSAGHVTPNLALIAHFQKTGWDIAYVGSQNGIEKDIITRIGIPYHAVHTGKLRRYLSWRTLIEPFKIIYGVLQAIFLCRRLRPDVVFSKGGFVAFPIVVGAWVNRVPVVIHEADSTPGLANRLCAPFAKMICITFPESKRYYARQERVVVSGLPIRQELLRGNAEQGRRWCGLSEDKPIILVSGGGLGSKKINEAVRQSLPRLLEVFQIIHLCGKGKLDPAFAETKGYRQFEYVNEELADLYACADLVISRSGANSVYEVLSLRKPHLFIPLSKTASRGDQITNANYFAKLGLSFVLAEEQLTPDNLLTLIHQIYTERTTIQAKLNAYQLPDSVAVIVRILESLVTHPHRVLYKH